MTSYEFTSSAIPACMAWLSRLAINQKQSFAIDSEFLLASKDMFQICDCCREIDRTYVRFDGNLVTVRTSYDLLLSRDVT